MITTLDAMMSTSAAATTTTIQNNIDETTRFSYEFSLLTEATAITTS